MGKRNPWLMVIVVICVLGLAQLACGDEDPPTPDPDGKVQLPAAIRGGGWIKEGEGKITFGFQLTCDRETDQVRGQFQYNDHVNGVAFHGVVQQEIVDCKVAAPSTSLDTDPQLGYTGEYTPQPRNAGDSGDLLLALSEETCLSVTLQGGFHDGYSYSGCLERGNIRFWMWPD